MPPVAPPVTVAEHEEQLVLAGDGGSGNVWLDQTAVPPVETRFAVVTIGPVIESWRTSIAASGEPAVRPAAASATRNVIELIWNRLNGPFSWIQSPAARLPRCDAARRPSVLVAVLVPDWLTTNSTSWCFWRIWIWLVGRQRRARRPWPPLSV